MSNNTNLQAFHIASTLSQNCHKEASEGPDTPQSLRSSNEEENFRSELSPAPRGSGRLEWLTIPSSLSNINTSVIERDNASLNLSGFGKSKLAPSQKSQYVEVVSKDHLKVDSKARDDFVQKMEKKYQVHEESKQAFQKKQIEIK